MIVIFIPAEFIQLSSGMSYPWYIALLCCDLGVVFGASIIYFIVHVFKFDGDIFKKSSKIKKYDTGENAMSTQVLMYFLFFMPIIPFGAICYYASNKKIGFFRYILTCATGVIPSIITSNIMGYGIRLFIANVLPLWVLILIIIGGAAVLFIAIFILLKHFYFNRNKNTPDYFLYNVIIKIAKIILGKTKIIVNAGEVSKIEGPYLVLSNHPSFFDFYYLNKIDDEKNYAFICNRHYFGVPVLGNLLRKGGIIPKKIFSSDIETIKKSFDLVKKGYSLVMMPEGRLSSDGTGNYINPSVAGFAIKLGIPVVTVNISNAYLNKPKWRKKLLKKPVNVTVKRIIDKDELKGLSADELYKVIAEDLRFNDFIDAKPVYKEKDKAENLENLLYYCPHCGTLFSNESHGNALVCKHCNKTYTIADDYSFGDSEIKNIHDYYIKIADYEKQFLGSVLLSIEVNTKIFHKNDNGFDKDEGVFVLTDEKVAYRSFYGESFEISSEVLEGIAYSVGEEFELYYKDRLHYFYPKKDKQICTRIALIYDLIKEKQRGDKKQR